MKTLNNLLSRVKNIFGHKATTATAASPATAPPTDLSVVSDSRLKAALADIEKYLTDNYGPPVAKLRYQDYTNGATLTSEDATFAVSLVILTATNGAAHLPDNVLLLGGVTSTNDADWLTEELGKFIMFLKKLGRTYRIQHLALAFSKEMPDHPATVKVNGLPLAQQEPDVTCIRLY